MSGAGIESVIGIDLGTTNSCVSFIDAVGDLRQVSVATGPRPPYDRVLATLVIDPLDEGGGPLIGLEAEAAQKMRPKDTYLGYFKHHLDEQRLKQIITKTKEVPTLEHDFVNDTVKMKTVSERIAVGGDYSRAELVAGTRLILQHLIQRAIAAGADPEARLLVGVPVAFSGYARKRIAYALSRVRLEDGRPLFKDFSDLMGRVRFVLEPVAVAAAPGEVLDIDDAGNVLIFDHGGGTLDLSIVHFARHPGFDRPVPVRELAAGGSAAAGKHFDARFMAKLMEDSEIAEALAELGDVERHQVVERCKRDLSTTQQARLPLTEFEVKRSTLNDAVGPLLAKIADEVERTLTRGGLSHEQLDWIVLTGGSSLVPVVQETMTELFPEVHECGQLLRYFPDDTRGVEKAITDVAEGLARYGQQSSLQPVVLWDVKLGTEGSGEFQTVFARGTEFKQRNGDYELVAKVALPDCENDYRCVGLYEDQLGPTFMFGVADVPSKPGSKALVRLRRGALFPTVAVLSSSGKVLGRGSSLARWDTDAVAAADVSKLGAGEAEAFLEEDAEYLPANRHSDFVAAPLVRLLCVGDHVEWCRRIKGGELVSSYGRGEIEQIRLIGGDVRSLPEMSGWDLGAHEFKVKTESKTGGTLTFQTRNGYMRLAPRPVVGL
jgi:actin-like ATPase involved in cell morphogenesis